VLAGEEGETKGQPPVPPAQALGGTRWLRERASRGMGACDGGQKARRRLPKAMKTWAQLARPRPALRLLPAGQRRDGQRLFERGQALGHQGTPGRPTQTCPRGVHGRGKPQGAPAPKTGRQRPQDPSPGQAPPATARPRAATAIQAHHAEACLRALRRPWAPGRSKPPRSAKATQGGPRL
jgi:hypothetical protein